MECVTLERIMWVTAYTSTRAHTHTSLTCSLQVQELQGKAGELKVGKCVYNVDEIKC